MTNNGMTVKFRSSCEFVFQGWTTQAGDYSTFLMGCTLVMFYCILHMNLWTLRQLLPQKNKLVTLAWYFVYVLSGILVMLFIMTMNGFVNIAVILGCTIGYAIQQQSLQILVKQNAEPPPGGCEFCS